MLALDIFILLLSLTCMGLLIRIWQKVKGNGRILLICAFAYLSIIRVLVVVRDLTELPIPTAQLSIGFYILMALGLWIFLREIKRTLRGNRG